MVRLVRFQRGFGSRCFYLSCVGVRYNQYGGCVGGSGLGTVRCRQRQESIGAWVLHVFTYSERPNTTAIDIKPIVPGHVRAERSKMLHILSDKKRRAFYNSQIGRDATVLFEEDIEDGMMHGFTENYVRVVAQYDPLLINEILPVRLTAVNVDGLMEATEVEAMLEHH